MLFNQISWQQIHHIWQTQLWPDRESAIETHSAMTWPYADMESEFSMGVFGYPVKFLGAFQDGELVAVNSGHLTDPFHYRTRGLWVHPDHRGRGIAQNLFAMLESHARIQGAIMMWSMPRLSAWHSYQLYGFHQVGEPMATETSDANVYACKFI